MSVLIATRDRAASLSRTLEGLAGQQLGGISWEVVVVDNGSSDSTQQVIDRARSSLPIVDALEPTPGKNRAVNRGLSVARGRLILFTDDDVEPAVDWVRALHDGASRWPEDNIFGGLVVPSFPSTAPAWITRADFPHGRWAFSTYAPRPDEGPTSETPLGPNLAMRARLLRGTAFDESMGPSGPDYAMGSEVEILLRFYRAGEQFIYLPRAVVHHRIDARQATKRALDGRAYRCGRGNARLFPGVGRFPVFGIPVYQWKRAVRAFLRLLVAPMRSQRERWLASMELHQVRGNIRERLRMLREAGSVEGASRQRLFPSRRAIVEAIRRRGLLWILLAPLAWALRPVVRWDRVTFFRSDLDPPREGEELDGVRIEVLRGVEARRDARTLLCRLELIKPEDVDARLERGDTVAVAVSESEPIGYAWSTVGDHRVRGIEATLRVGPTEVVGYDGFVVAEWRRKGVIGALDAVQMRLAADLGRRRQWVYASSGDRFAVRSLEKMGKVEAFTASALSLPLLGKRYGPVVSSRSLETPLDLR